MDSSQVEIITAVANVATAVGVLFTAGQLWVSRRQHSSSTEIHVVQLHTHFQQQIREIQKSFPPEVVSSNWMPKPGSELRSIQLYWYVVFDEWYTCHYVSREPRLNDLWERYRFGVMSALTSKAFDLVVTNMLKDDAVFFGLAQEFAKEIDGLRPKKTNK